jgi:hypothetical protein
MFNLIVAVISIALIAAMAAASIFYGGSAFSSGTAQAQATTLINNGQQIGGAQQLYMIDNSGNRAVALSTLTVVGGYLQAAPTPPSVAGGFVAPEWAINDDGKIATIAFTNPGGDNSVSATICKELFNQGGATGTVPETGITTGAPTAASLGTDQFGCFSDGDPLVVTVAVKL